MKVTNEKEKIKKDDRPARRTDKKKTKNSYSIPALCQISVNIGEWSWEGGGTREALVFEGWEGGSCMVDGGVLKSSQIVFFH